MFGHKKQFIRHQYTIIELLVVLVLAGILTGIAVGGIKGVLGRQGATGAVRTLSNKIALARSFAVSRNRYVALLMPDYEALDDSSANLGGNTAGYTIADYTTFSRRTYCFTRNRLCYVTKITGTATTYDWERWVKDYEWQELPQKTVAFICQQGTSDSTPVQVEKVPDPTASGTKNCTALIFKPSGALIGGKSVIVRVFRAAYFPSQNDHVFYWQGKEDKNQGWKIIVNGFTGRAKYYLGNENVAE
ncbi:MAG: hypothetical protein PHH77_12780 [Victivallaceae bacterium]|nr:hypothetical protein [Victivallaceae bacterium]